MPFGQAAGAGERGAGSPTPSGPLALVQASPSTPGKQTSVTIYKKMQVIEFWKSLDKTVTGREMVTMTRFPESLTAQGMLGRWVLASQKFAWHLVPTEIQRSCKALPNWLKCDLCEANAKGTSLDIFLPYDLQQEYDKLLVSRIHGLGPGNNLNTEPDISSRSRTGLYDISIE